MKKKIKKRPVTLLGHVWSKDRSEFPNWEIEVTFRINGRGRIGADGLVSLDNLFFFCDINPYC